MRGSCDCIVAYNGDSPLRELSVPITWIPECVEDEKEAMREYLTFNDAKNIQDLRQLLINGTIREILARNYDISVYCPKCGEKINWGDL